MIIGLSGVAGCGKNTVAEVLARQCGAKLFAFADPLYAAVSAITGIPVKNLQDRGFKEKELSWLPASPRRLLQTLGTEWGRDTIHEEIWIRSVFRAIKAESPPVAVITDVRFNNEAFAIRERGGSVWLVTRKTAGLGGDEGGHSSEKGVRRDLIDEVVANDGAMADLEKSVGFARSRTFIRLGRTPLQ